ASMRHRVPRTDMEPPDWQRIEIARRANTPCAETMECTQRTSCPKGFDVLHHHAAPGLTGGVRLRRVCHGARRATTRMLRVVAPPGRLPCTCGGAVRSPAARSCPVLDQAVANSCSRDASSI